jgi:ABC-type glycerol-3-phosphate transport system substrate-binding protein
MYCNKTYPGQNASLSENQSLNVPPVGRSRGRRPSVGFLPALLLILLLLLGGCASFSPDEVGARHAANPQIVVLWHTFTGVEAKGLETLTDRFNADNPWDIVLITEYQERLLEKLRGAPEIRPDLVTIWPQDLQLYMTLGIDGVSPLQSPEMQEIWADVLPMARSLYAVNGEPQALPLGLATYIAYHNVEWLSDLGYSATTATWEDFRRTACGATDPARGQVGVGMPARASTLLAFLTASGSQIVGEDGYYHFADIDGRAAASVLHALVSGQCGLVYEDWDVGLSRLSKSSMAMIIESSEYLAEIQYAILKGRNFQLGISPLPGQSGPGPTLWYGPGLMISAPEGERSEAAQRVMSWFFSTESQKYWGATTSYLPVRRSVIAARLNKAQQAMSVSIETQLLSLTLAAADNETWVVWPLATNRITCRASLLRGLLALQNMDADAPAYIDTAVTACNTGVNPRPLPTATPLPESSQ